MSEAETVPSHGPSLVVDGEWAGWSRWTTDAFETLAGPFYERHDDAGVVCAFRAEPRHMNGGGFMHGGCLMTFADFALFSIAHEHLTGAHAVTLNMNSDFLDTAHSGELIEARGNVTRAGKSTIFVRGTVTADARPVLGFSGIVRKVGKRN